MLNAGSSSVKYALFSIAGAPARWSRVVHGLAEGIATKTECRIKEETHEGKKVHKVDLPDHRTALSRVVDLLPGRDSISSVGHRVVHGGESFKAAALINPRVLQAVRDATVLAPLHNPWNILGIEVAEELFGRDCPQVAVFDTAFHQTMPPRAYMYALPYDLYKTHHIRKYGFHGTSYLYVAEETSRVLKKPLDKLNIIACHVGNGASMAAIKQGRCIDTTMGMTPLEGLVMGTRCGDIDPAVPSHLIEQLGYSVKEVNNLMNKESGLLGLCGLSDDRDVEREYFEQKPRGTLAKEVQVYRMRKYLGAFMVALDGQVDALVFTGGLGEKSHLLRTLVCQGLDRLGLEIVEEANQAKGGRFSDNTRLDSKRLSTQIWVIPTDEELCIAQQTQMIVSKDMVTQ